MTAHLINLAIAAAVVVLVTSQCRKPRWLLGRLMVSTMNRSHSAVTDWALAHVEVKPRFSILDVGCGGGRTIQKLAAKAAAGHVSGVDYSTASAAAARRSNAEAIAAGRVTVVQASVSQLPFPPASFDLVTAVETHYYWPNLGADLREIRRTLKTGGHVLLVAEAYRRPGPASAVAGLLMRGLGGVTLTVDQHREALTAAGFTNVAIDEDRGKGWICARGESPGPD